MAEYTDDDRPHEPTDDPDWQESFVLVFRDRATDAVGFLRTGTYANQGTSQVHWGMALPDGTRFRRHRLRIPFEREHWAATSARSGEYMRYSITDTYTRYEGTDDDAEADLRLYDFFPSQDWDAIGMDVPSALRGGHAHPEASGRVEGRIRIGDRVIDIDDGIGHRDHSFGPRPHTMFRTARWHAGSVGPELSYSLVTSVADNGTMFKFGWLMRGGVREQILDLHTVNMVLSDGYSSIGGWSVVRLASGEVLRIEAETIDGVVTSTHEVNGGPGSSPAGIEALSIARWNGHDGVCDFNMIDNAHRGEQPISDALLANTDEGVTVRHFDPTWIRR